MAATALSRHADSIGVGASELSMEITPAMIEAGAAEVATYSPEATTAASVAVDVFVAMLRASGWVNAKPRTRGRRPYAASGRALIGY